MHVIQICCLQHNNDRQPTSCQLAVDVRTSSISLLAPGYRENDVQHTLASRNRIQYTSRYHLVASPSNRYFNTTQQNSKTLKLYSIQSLQNLSDTLQYTADLLKSAHVSTPQPPQSVPLSASTSTKLSAMEGATGTLGDKGTVSVSASMPAAEAGGPKCTDPS